MSGHTPAQRLRTKTSDITDFFRGGGQSSTQSRRDSTGPTSLEVPPSDNEGGTGKKKITRIPLFGRTRKISTASTSSSPYTSTSNVRPSSETAALSSRAPSSDRERRPSEPTITQTFGTSKLPSSSSTFSSKLAARFNPSQSKKRPVTSSGPVSAVASSSRTSLLSPTTGLTPPNPRPSFESGSTAGSKARSTTPRPTRPMITVSTTDNMDEFKDLFTQEISKPSTNKIPKQVSSVSSDPEKSLKFSPPPSPIIFAPGPSSYKRGQTPASALAAAVRDRQAAHERHSSTSSKSSRKTPDSDKGSSSDKHEGRSTPRLSSPRESPRLIVIDKEKGLPQPTQRRPSLVAVGSNQLPDNQSASLRSRNKPVNGARSRPPSIPLPQLPPTASSVPLPSSEYPPSPNVDQTDFSETESRKSRSRANTIASIPDLPTVPPSPSLPENSFDLKLPVDIHSFVGDEFFDIDTASPGQLRRALRTRNQNFDDLAALLLKKEEEWLMERKTLEKKVSSLQRDLVRRESEITGLKLIISDEDILQRPKPLPPGILNHSRLSPLVTAVQDSDQDTYSSPSSPPARRLQYGSDSGAESHRASGGSGNESTGSHLRTKKIQRFATGNELKYSGSTRRSPRYPPGLHEKSLPETPQTKRISLMSTTSSASSSSSSLLPPSPSITMSSLSAIPEGNTTNARVSGVSSDSEDRRAVRAAHRISTSSMTSSSTAASSSYSSNFKRSRPPSIAQVLDKTPNVESALDKLRPFA
ncbi:hypothetical protein CPB83DRAFT_892559 [Crepidotus variabilis]|uniref:Uncharacterized protein n=1 Tax=Crepidotus variabilis TaxID=179855 RepID=A0A9P6EK87_9AGAR|nr:hypothetical protein CPB83DRAFT_892559 [Crepidotus variabilis]